jgi:quaternary ammonium compound-resistance protein SugE
VNPWLLIVIAGILETAWALGLKYSEGFTKFWPSVFTVVTALGSFWLLSLAMKSLPVGTAYAVWVGIGVMGTVIFGVVLLAAQRKCPRRSTGHWPALHPNRARTCAPGAGVHGTRPSAATNPLAKCHI